MKESDFDAEARAVEARLPAGRRVVVIGSTAFWHAESERTSAAIGRRLAGVDGLVLLTGGVNGAGECVGRAFAAAWTRTDGPPPVFHVLPHGWPDWDYGQTLFAGADMEERREVLARLAKIYVVIEGGPGTEHEATVARSLGSLMIPVGRSGGHAGLLFPELPAPRNVPRKSWDALGDLDATPDTVAEAVALVVQNFFA